MFLTEAGGEVTITLRAIARSRLGWYPQKTITIHPVQLRALEILVKRARGLLDGGTPQPSATDAPDGSKVIPLPVLDASAVRG